MDRFSEYLEDLDKFVRWPTLIVGYILLTGIIVAIETVLSGKGYWYIRGGIYLVILALWFGTWHYHRRKLPKNREDKIGILISLKTENDKEKSRLKNDTYARLKELIAANNLDGHINVTLATNYQAERLEPFLDKVANEARKPQRDRDPLVMEHWEKIQSNMKFVFYVYGSVKERQHKENTYFIDNNMIVGHPPINEAKRKELTQDIVSIWSPQFRFPEKAEYGGFRFTAEFLYLEAMYIIGCAAFACGDISSALRLHTALDRELAAQQIHPNFRSIAQRLRKLLSEEHRITAYLAYVLEKDLSKANTHVERCLQYDSQNYGGHITKSLIEYLYEGDPRKALQTITVGKKWAPGSDGTWRYTQGFLQMTLERFPDALKTYRQIENNTYVAEEITLGEVIEFNRQLLNRNPEHIQSLYILGFLAHVKQHNHPLALEYFDHFIRKARLKPKFKILVNEAQKYKGEIERNMGLK